MNFFDVKQYLPNFNEMIVEKTKALKTKTLSEYNVINQAKNFGQVKNPKPMLRQKL